MNILLQEPLERARINTDIPDGPHPLLSLLLFLQQLHASRWITTIQLRGNILSQRLDGFSRHNLSPHRRLDDDFEQLAVEKLLEAADPVLAEGAGLRAVDDLGDGVDGDVVDEELELDNVGFVVAGFFVVEGGVALCDALEFTKEVVDELGEGEAVAEDDLGGGEEGELLLLAAVGFA